MTYVFLLQHIHVFPDGEEDMKFIGVYSTEENARRDVVERLRKLPGFCDEPDFVSIIEDPQRSGFYLTKSKLDECAGWSSGFVTYSY